MADNLKIVVTGDAKNAEGMFDRLRGKAGGLGNVLQTGLGVALGGLITQGIPAVVDGLKSFIDSASESEQATAKVQQVINATGGAAGITAEQAQNLATSLQNVTRFSDESVLGAEAVLLRFRTIGKETFPDATKASLNLAQSMGIDATSAAQMLGKALVDPGVGLLRLKTAGVAFDDAQIEIIKHLAETGQTAQAQKMILDELNKSIGGAAEAAGNTFAGKMDILGNRFDDIKEKIGGAFIPLLTQGATALADFLGRPEIQSGLNNLVNGITALAQQAAGFVAALNIDWNAIWKAMFTPTLDLAFGAGTFDSMIAGLQAGFDGLMAWVTDTLAPALSNAFAQISTAAGPALQMLGSYINTYVLPALQQLGNWLGPLLLQGLQQLGNFIVTQALPALTQLAVWILTQGVPAFAQFAMWIGGQLNTAFRAAGQLWTILVIGFQQAGTFIETVKQHLLDLANVLVGQVAAAFQWFMTNVLDPIKEALANIRMWISLTIDALNHLGAMASGAGIPNNFGGARAAGGAVSAGETYLVGENGPELFTPRGGGNIIPHGAWGGGLVVNLTYAPLISTASADEARDRLLPIVTEALRRGA